MCLFKSEAILLLTPSGGWAKYDSYSGFTYAARTSAVHFISVKTRLRHVSEFFCTSKWSFLRLVQILDAIRRPSFFTVYIPDFLPTMIGLGTELCSWMTRSHSPLWVQESQALLSHTASICPFCPSPPFFGQKRERENTMWCFSLNKPLMLTRKQYERQIN